MAAFVLDASLTLSWCFEEEGTPETNTLLELLKTKTAEAPALWLLEVMNILVLAERRGRISEIELFDYRARVGKLPVDIDPETHTRAVREIFQLARTHQLTTYDAAYLELALRRGLPLATQDQALRAQAQALGIAVLPT